MNNTPQEARDVDAESVDAEAMPEEATPTPQSPASARTPADAAPADAAASDEMDEDTAVVDAVADAPDEPATSRTLGTVPASGPIPVVGDAIPITGAVPVIKPIYPPKKRLPWIISTIVLILILIGAGYLGWRMYEINLEWQDYSAQLEEANYALGEQIADEQAIVMEKQAEIDLLSEQLATSNARVLDLADEKATAVDGQEFNEQLIEGLNDTLVLGQTATASANSCIDGLEQLTEYLSAPEDEYDPEEVQDYADGVEELCAASDTATANFQSALAAE